MKSVGKRPIMAVKLHHKRTLFVVVEDGGSNLWPSGTTDPHSSVTFTKGPRFHWTPLLKSSSTPHLFFFLCRPPAAGTPPDQLSPPLLAGRQYWLRRWSNSHFVRLLLEVAMTSTENRREWLLILIIIIRTGQKGNTTGTGWRWEAGMEVTHYFRFCNVSLS